MSKQFYVVSLAHTKKWDGVITLWNPNDAGYCYRLERAGKYKEEDIRAHASYYNDGVNSIAVECSTLEKLATKVGETPAQALDWNVDTGDAVVKFSRLRSVKARRFKL